VRLINDRIKYIEGSTTLLAHSTFMDWPINNECTYAMSFNLGFKFMYNVLGYKVPLVVVDITVKRYRSQRDGGQLTDAIVLFWM
jgi:hypothetical protein